MPSDRRLARLAQLLMKIHLRRQTVPKGSREDEVLGIVEDETEAELRNEAQRLDAIAAPRLAATDTTAGGRDTAN
jgi:hypothetical protein